MEKHLGISLDVPNLQKNNILLVNTLLPTASQEVSVLQGMEKHSSNSRLLGLQSLK